MCPKCGAIVGAGEDSCAVCGFSATAPATQTKRAPDRESVRFARAILLRPHKFTILLLVANFFMFLLMWQSSGTDSTGIWEFPPQVLIAYGAKLNFLINDQRQWWRFVTPMFLHAGLIHLLVNMYALWILGPYVEKLYGSAKFVVFWVASGIGGVVASYLTVVGPDTNLNSLLRFLLKRVDAPSVGASGALFGLVGVLFVFGIKFRRELPEGFKRAFGTGLLPMILLNLFIGYLGRGFIDNAAHLGGMLSGAALAVALDYRRPGERAGVAIAWRVLQSVSLLLLVLSFVKVAQHFRDPLTLPAVVQSNLQPEAPVPDSVKYFRALNDAQEALIGVLQDRNATLLESAAAQLDTVPSLDPQADALRERMKALLANASKIHQADKSTTANANTASPKPAAEYESLLKDFAAWTVDYNRWLKTEGRNYGVSEAASPEASPQ